MSNGTAPPLLCHVFLRTVIQQLLTSLSVKLMGLRVRTETALAHES